MIIFLEWCSESMEYLMHTVDNCIQYGEDHEPREVREQGDIDAE